MEIDEIGQLLILAFLALYGVWEVIIAIKRELSKKPISKEHFDPKTIIKEYKELLKDIKRKEISEKIHHERIYYETIDFPLKETMYLSNYLVPLSLVGFLLMWVIAGVTSFMGEPYTVHRLFLFLGGVFIASRMSHHATLPIPFFTATFGIVSGGLSVLLIHEMTGLTYVHSFFSFILCVGLFGGTLHAILEFKPLPAVIDNYSHTVGRLLLFLQLGFILVLVTKNLFFFSLIFGSMWVETNLKLQDRRKKGLNIERRYYSFIKKRFLSDLPFQKPLESCSLQEDFSHFVRIQCIFKGFSWLEILYWGLMTPLVLIPLTCYVQVREERIKEKKRKVCELAEKKYLISADMVADVVQVELPYAYRILNDLHRDNFLRKYGSPGGIVYGLHNEEVEQSLVEYLQTLELDKKEKELLRYFKEKREYLIDELTQLEILKMDAATYEIAAEQRVRGAKQVVRVPIDTEEVTELQKNLDLTVRSYVAYHSYTEGLDHIKKYGRELYRILDSVEERLDVPYVLLETNVPDIPWELAYADTFFGLNHAVGRCVRTQKGITQNVPWRLEELKALVIASPENLVRVEQESDFLVGKLEEYITVDYVKGEDATYKNVIPLLKGTYDIVHFAGHAHPDGLQLSDGVITATDIAATYPGGSVVFVNACHSGKGFTTAGLAEPFIASGALAFIGSFWPVHDEAAAQVALDFYMRAFQLSGECLPVGEALRRSKLKSFVNGERAWVTFVLYGDPRLQLL